MTSAAASLTCRVRRRRTLRLAAVAAVSACACPARRRARVAVACAPRCAAFRSSPRPRLRQSAGPAQKGLRSSATDSSAVASRKSGRGSCPDGPGIRHAGMARQRPRADRRARRRRRRSRPIPCVACRFRGRRRTSRLPDQASGERGSERSPPTASRSRRHSAGARHELRGGAGQAAESVGRIGRLRSRIRPSVASSRCATAWCRAGRAGRTSQAGAPRCG